jgi:serine/threonine protein kinase
MQLAIEMIEKDTWGSHDVAKDQRLVRYCETCMAAFQAARVCPRDNTKTRVDIGDPLLGAVLGERYRIIDRRASGGMGQVYQAAHTRIASVFAVKVMFGDIAYDASMRARFTREAEIASLLQSRHIVRVVDFSQSESGLLYIAMEYLDGDALADLVDREAPLHPIRALKLTRQIARGLAHAHDRGVIHRDLKCENVILVRDDDGDDEEVAKILDFGVARLKSDSRLTAAGAVLGTPLYMAPEQIGAGEVDGRADLYALGVTLFTMLTGTYPYLSDSIFEMARLQRLGSRSRMSSVLGQTELAARIDALLDRLLAPDVDARMASARDVIKAVSEILESETRKPERPSLGALPPASVPGLTGSVPPGPPRAPVDEPLLEAIRRVITRGAPTYNEGNHAGCFALYRDAAQELIRARASGLKSIAATVRLRVALSQAEHLESPTLRAWTMRHAFDDLLAAQPIMRRPPRDMVDETIDEFFEITDRTYALGHEHALAPFHIAFAMSLRDVCRGVPSRAPLVAPLERAIGELQTAPPNVAVATLAQTFERIRGEALSVEVPAAAAARTAVGAPITKAPPFVRDAIVRALRVGVPAYNQGDHAGCAREYLRAAEQIVQESAKFEDTQLLASWLAGIVQSAKGSTPTAAAWAVRHAFDALLALP